MFTGWPDESNIMNQGSIYWADAGCLRPADDDHSQEDDLQLLLESPTALAAQYNYFSTHLSGDPNCNHDPLRQNSLVGSPDFSRQLNTAGMLDAGHTERHTQPCLLSLQLTGSFQPDSLLLTPSQDPQQASCSMPAPHVAGAAAPVAPPAVPCQSTEAHPSYELYQILQQRQQARYAVQNALHNHQHAPSMGWMVQLPAASTFRLPGSVLPQPQVYVAHAEGPMLQADNGLHAQQQQQVLSVVHMPAVEDLPVSTAPRKKRAMASLAHVLRPVPVPCFGEPLPQVPVVTYAKAADEKPGKQGNPEPQQQQQPAQLGATETQQQQQPEPMNLRRRPMQQWQRQVEKQPVQVEKQPVQVEKQPVQKQAGKQQPSGSAAVASPAQPAAHDVLGTGMESLPVSVAPSRSTCATQPKVSQATISTAAPAGISAAGLGKGTLVWAKFPRFPWWPAIIMMDAAAAVCGHSTSSSCTSRATTASMLVRFLGTYDAAWVEPKAVSRWNVSQHERTSKTKAAAFTKALKEAATYLHTGDLPEEFQEPPHLIQAPPPAGKQKQGKQPSAEGTTRTAAELLLQQPDVWLLVPRAAPTAGSSSPRAHQPNAAVAAAALLQHHACHVGDSDAVWQGHAQSASAAHSSNTSSSGGDSTPPHPAPMTASAAKRKAPQSASKGKRSNTGR